MVARGVALAVPVMAALDVGSPAWSTTDGLRLSTSCRPCTPELQSRSRHGCDGSTRYRQWVARIDVLSLPLLRKPGTLASFSSMATRLLRRRPRQSAAPHRQAFHQRILPEVVLTILMHEDLGTSVNTSQLSTIVNTVIGVTCVAHETTMLTMLSSCCKYSKITRNSNKGGVSDSGS